MSKNQQHSHFWSRLILWIITIGSPLAALAWVYAGPAPSSNDWLLETISYGDIEQSVIATGTLEPKNYVEVGAQVSGQVKDLLVEEGDQVEKGQLLAIIDASVFELKVKTAEASLENLRAQLAQQVAELELDRARLRRNEGLFQRKAISEDSLIESRTTVTILEAKIAASKASIKADTASLESDKVSLGYTRIYAPIAGTIASISVREGQTLNATNSAPTVLTISDLTVMTLRAEVSEADVPKLSRGMDVRFSTLGNLRDYRWSKIRQILPTPNIVNDVVLYQVLVDVDNSDHRLMDSMTAKVFFVEGAASNVLVAPLAAIRMTPRGNLAMVPGSTEARMVPVEIGIQNRTQVEIRSGLQEGDMVISGSKQKAAAAAAKSMTGSDRMGPGGGMGGPRRG